ARWQCPMVAFSMLTFNRAHCSVFSASPLLSLPQPEGVPLPLLRGYLWPRLNACAMIGPTVVTKAWQNWRHHERYNRLYSVAAGTPDLTVYPLLVGTTYFVYLITSLSVQTLQDIVAAFSLSVGQSLLLLLVVIILILLVAIGLYAISWRFYQFRITSDAVELHAGVIFRRRRYMRLDRLQAVDIDRPFFARIFGLSKLALHAADGSETTLTLEYLKETDAEQLRREIL